MPTIRNTFGALFIGTIIASMYASLLWEMPSHPFHRLFGITNLQTLCWSSIFHTLIYYKSYPDDWSLYRYSVHVMVTYYYVHSTYALYYYLIDMHGTLLGALGNNTCFHVQLQLAINVVIVMYVQGPNLFFLVGWHFNKILSWFMFLTVAASLGKRVALLASTHFPHYASSVSFRHRNIYNL
ncbi:uncharacterized protein EV420DRAFT_1566614 [Desarmillaria tabescens]|uniref:Uncharacterized protein n=1 Tax=Armillaria tabescens TaxID=1929756 RepID=A0AA39JXG9_ARMTA|nr:uncharacterized protein EV420DRAFT_1566614 [Desarmillaria tabescens]KAK0448408.1 hypothetical protein EV420DRAFT_1566614 [Desarmillaria tabescens]